MPCLVQVLRCSQPKELQGRDSILLRAGPGSLTQALEASCAETGWLGPTSSLPRPTEDLGPRSLPYLSGPCGLWTHEGCSLSPCGLELGLRSCVLRGPGLGVTVVFGDLTKKRDSGPQPVCGSPPGPPLMTEVTPVDSKQALM